MDCKVALETANGELAKAKGILREKGMAKADRKAGKATGQGRIGSYIHSNGMIGAMVELHCETDFVAKNAEFLDLLHDLCLQVAGANPEVVSKEELPAELVEKEKAKYAEEVKGKPPHVAEKILEGKLDKNLFAHKCLLHQSFLNEAKFQGTVADMIKTKIAKIGENITVRRFARFDIAD
ncbi:MAG: hypothetical protein A2Z34_06145 [Planctomycetes bacterium RBG_16_59_8]|nr:MAG: hypothetical protein A2Z34_06145 [Planctomycetes bacterium RBG_16_59_8]